MDCLQKKMHVMQCQLQKVCRENKLFCGKLQETVPKNISKRPQTSVEKPCKCFKTRFCESDSEKLHNLKVAF